MEFKRPQIQCEGESDPCDIYSYDEFRVKRGLPGVANQTLINHMERGNLDFTTIGHFRYIVWNDKARKFNLNYQKQLHASD